MQSSGQSQDRTDRDGIEYRLNVILYFDGRSDFDVQAFLNDNFVVSGKYTRLTGKGYIQSKFLI